MGLVELFATPDWLVSVLKKLKQLRDTRESELNTLAETFGSFRELAPFYVEPNCQDVNPADEPWDHPLHAKRNPVMTEINLFLDELIPSVSPGQNQMFILSDAGMGKTSLLMMIKLTHVCRFWPKPYHCVLKKLGEHTLDEIAKVEEKSKTVLLLDALDEDPRAWNNLRARVLQILDTTKHFYRVIISCRTQFFPKDEIDPFNRLRIRVGSYICPTNFLSLFDDGQVDLYLHRRFEKSSRPKVEKTRRIQKGKEVMASMGTLRFRPLLLVS